MSLMTPWGEVLTRADQIPTPWQLFQQRQAVVQQRMTQGISGLSSSDTKRDAVVFVAAGALGTILGPMLAPRLKWLAKGAGFVTVGALAVLLDRHGMLPYASKRGS